MTREENEVKLLRLACEECCPVSVKKTDLLAKPNLICVGTEHVALSPLDIDAQATKIERGKLLCNACGTAVGYTTASAPRRGHAFDGEHRNCNHEQDQAQSQTTRQHGHCCEPSEPEANDEVAEFCFMKYRSTVKGYSADTVASDIFWRHTQVSLIAASIERVCKKDGIHRFLVEAHDEGSSNTDNTGGPFAGQRANTAANVELVVVVREFFPIFIPSKAQQVDADGSTKLRSRPAQLQCRAMKALGRSYEAGLISGHFVWLNYLPRRSGLLLSREASGNLLNVPRASNQFLSGPIRHPAGGLPPHLHGTRCRPRMGPN
ncbi:hypothetical protein BESB_019830 [Besnoitia besnoiti]|uniref:Uncharacterized protein n=1 Tax=Besnoitia besnoiti TaxID=94643 RepID=A0A2A9M9J1_BESBE|nr:hypothetical protein BESB_019830 [Besnoitia besnoiti]PFH32042.1 hypothetical protein BESB_019830 [Besnoitia besnoiti]